MKRVAPVVLASILAACGGASPPPPAPATAPNTASSSAPAPRASAPPQTALSWDAVSYRTAIDEAIEAMLVSNPIAATERGEHRFDDQLPDISDAAQARIAADFTARAQGLRTIAASVPADAAPGDAGTDHPALDARLLADHLDGTAFEISSYRPFERDPSRVLTLVGEAIVGLTDHEYAPKHARMDALATRLARVPATLEVARGRLKNPSHAALENLAVVANGLSVMLRGAGVGEWTRGLEADAPLQARLRQGAEAAAVATLAYAAAVQKTFPIASAKDEPMGTEMWAKLALLNEGVTESPAEVRAMGEKELARLQTELDALIRDQNKSGRPAETRAAFFARLEKETPPPDGVLAEYRAAQSRVEAWMHEHPVVTVPWEKASLAVVPTPPHERGVSFASMNMAGILEPSISDARLQVNEPQPSMPANRREALLRFNALGAIDLVVLHEGFPGHYLQGLFARANPSKVRKVLWPATSGEGWAHYCEEMAYENGYPAKDPMRMHAFYLRMALQRAVRVIVDVGENDGSLTLAQGAKLLEDNALLAPEAAKIEARRAVVSPVNMFTYTYGKLAILRMRDAVKAREGTGFDLRRFHDRLLSAGNLPVREAGRVAFGLD